MASEVLVPSSPAEAVALFGDGAGTTVIGGGTVVVPEHHLRPARPGARAPALAGRPRRRQPSTATRSRSARRPRSTPCSTSRIRSPRSRPAPATSPTTRSAARARSAATSASAPARAPRGDLQGCLLALDAHGPLGGRGRRADGAARGLPRAAARPARPRRQLRAAGRVGVRGARVSAHPRVHRARRDGRARRRRHDAARRDRRRRARRAPPLRRGARLRSGGGRRGRRRATSRFADDALASAWYREQTLPVLVRRVLTQLEESA